MDLSLLFARWIRVRVALALVSLLPMASVLGSEAGMLRAAPDAGSVTPLTPGPASVSGEFVIANTSEGGAGVAVETMKIVLDHRRRGEDAWQRASRTCTLDPPAPVEVTVELSVAYQCELASPAPAGAELRAVAEVAIAGNDEIFRLAGRIDAQE